MYLTACVHFEQRQRHAALSKAICCELTRGNHSFAKRAKSRYENGALESETGETTSTHQFGLQKDKDRPSTRPIRRIPYVHTVPFPFSWPPPRTPKYQSSFYATLSHSSLRSPVSSLHALSVYRVAPCSGVWPIERPDLCWFAALALVDRHTITNLIRIAIAICPLPLRHTPRL
jgi:hypothetical protein